MTGVDRLEQLTRLLNGELGGLAFGDAVFGAADGSERIKRDRVTLDQGVEEMPQGGECLVLSRRRAGEPINVFTGETRRDLAQLKTALVAPGQEAAGNSAISPAGVFVIESRLEEFLSCERGIWGGWRRTMTAAAGIGSSVGAPAGAITTSSLDSALSAI
jgi:hypothetical protein